MNIFGSTWGFFKKIFGSEQNWEKAAIVTLTVAQPLVTTLLTLTAGPVVAASVGGVIAQVQADLKTVNDIVVKSGATPIVSITLVSILTNLNEIEASLDIKDPTHQQAATLITQTLIGEIEAVIAELPNAASAAQGKA